MFPQASDAWSNARSSSGDLWFGSFGETSHFPTIGANWFWKRTRVLVTVLRHAVSMNENRTVVTCRTHPSRAIGRHRYLDREIQTDDQQKTNWVRLTLHRRIVCSIVILWLAFAVHGGNHSDQQQHDGTARNQHYWRPRHWPNIVLKNCKDVAIDRRTKKEQKNSYDSRRLSARLQLTNTSNRVYFNCVHLMSTCNTSGCVC